MRHAQMGLAVPDFPTAYGQLMPPMDDASIAKINQQRMLAGELDSSRVQILLHMAHRAGAVFAFLAVAFAVDRLLRSRQTPHIFRRGAWSWLILVGIQVLLGAFVVWTNKAADVATMHVLI